MFDASRLNEPAIHSHHRLCSVQRAIQADLSQPMTLISAARLAGLEPHYFCVLFHSRAGVRFKEWVTHVRIEAAQRLLAGSDQRITDIAFIVGYNDLRSFERAFLRHSEMTPMQFRARPRLVRHSDSRRAASELTVAPSKRRIAVFNKS